ncbi:MAG: class II glutamine amidotransferase [Byssovorax sp.]
MCRLIGACSAGDAGYAFCLQGAPRSLAALSPEHPHGWGLAVHDGAEGWSLVRSPACARDDQGFSGAAERARGPILIAHIRKRTVGPVRVENTHPFRRGRWVFAHNGTVTDLDFLTRRTSPARLAEIEGDTDSERLFAFLLTALDEAASTMESIGNALARALRSAILRPDFGTANLLLSDGRSLFTFRAGRSLYLLDRKRAPASPVADAHRRRPAVLVASERLTDEPWDEIPEGALLRIDGGEAPRVARVA